MDSRDRYGLAFGNAYASVEFGCERSAALSDLCGDGWVVGEGEEFQDGLEAWPENFWADVAASDAPLPTEELLGADHPYVEYTVETYGGEHCTKLDIPARRPRFISWVMA